MPMGLNISVNFIRRGSFALSLVSVDGMHFKYPGSWSSKSPPIRDNEQILKVFTSRE